MPGLITMFPRKTNPLWQENATEGSSRNEAAREAGWTKDLQYSSAAVDGFNGYSYGHLLIIL